MADQRVKKILIDATREDIIDAYCEDVETVPTIMAKKFFHGWYEKVPRKLIRQCILAGVFWAHLHPETITIEEIDDQN